MSAQEQENPNVLFRFRDTEQTSISLSGIKYASKDEVDEVIHILQDNPRIRSIDLSNVNMAPHWLADVLEAAASCGNLVELTLSGNPMPDKVAHRLVAALPRWPALRELACDNCGLGEYETGLLCKALEGSPLQTLSLRGNRPGKSIGAIDTLLDKTPALREVMLSDCALDNAAFLTIGRAICRHDRLGDAEMYYNSEGEEARQALAGMLAGNHVRNLVSAPANMPELSEYCGQRHAEAQTLLAAIENLHTQDAGFAALGSAALAAAQARMPAIGHLGKKSAALPAFCDFIGALPQVDKVALRKEDLFEQDGNGLTPLHNRQTWEAMESILPALGVQGDALTATDLLRPAHDGQPLLLAGLAGKPEKLLPVLNEYDICVPVDALLDKRQPTFLLERMIADGTAPMLMTADNLHAESPQAVRALYHALPPEQQEQVPNLHSLIAGLDSTRQAGLGR